MCAVKSSPTSYPSFWSSSQEKNVECNPSDLSYLLHIQFGQSSIVLGGDTTAETWEKLYKPIKASYMVIFHFSFGSHDVQSGIWQRRRSGFCAEGRAFEPRRRLPLLWVTYASSPTGLFISRRMNIPRSRYLPVGPDFRGLSVFSVFIFQ
jgi:hypothetical protein